MLIPIQFPDDLEKERCMSDLIRNANSKEYTGVKGFKQKYIDLMYHLGIIKTINLYLNRKVHKVWSLQLV